MGSQRMDRHTKGQTRLIIKDLESNNNQKNVHRISRIKTIHMVLQDLDLVALYELVLVATLCLDSKSISKKTSIQWTPGSQIYHSKRKIIIGKKSLKKQQKNA